MIATETPKNDLLKLLYDKIKVTYKRDMESLGDQNFNNYAMPYAKAIAKIQESFDCFPEEMLSIFRVSLNSNCPVGPVNDFLHILPFKTKKLGPNGKYYANLVPVFTYKAYRHFYRKYQGRDLAVYDFTAEELRKLKENNINQIPMNYEFPGNWEILKLDDHNLNTIMFTRVNSFTESFTEVIETEIYSTKELINGNANVKWSSFWLNHPRAMIQKSAVKKFIKSRGNNIQQIQEMLALENVIENRFSIDKELNQKVG